MTFPRRPLPLAAALLLAFAAAPAAAANYADDAARAAGATASGSGAGWTIYVDVTFGMRKDSAAKELNEAHLAFAARGFELAAVTAHEENGDLQGFFVTYRRR